MIHWQRPASIGPATSADRDESIAQVLVDSRPPREHERDAEEHHAAGVEVDFELPIYFHHVSGTLPFSELGDAVTVEDVLS